jgi:hypothetical protein
MKKEPVYISKENFFPILWEEVINGQEIYTEGTVLGKFMAYGPHHIHNRECRELINAKGQIFLSYPEDLLVRKS